MSLDLDVSIVVPTYNRCVGLNRLLLSLVGQTYPRSRFEVIVVDDGSTDATPEVIRSLALPYAVRSLRQHNGGPAVARNVGVQEAQGRLILFLDDDVVPHPELIATHVQAHGDAPNLVVTGPMLPPPDDFPLSAWDRWDAGQLDKQYRAMAAGEYACSQRQFFTANASLRRETFLAAGGFDPEFRRAEDVELAWRLHGLGAEFVFEPRAPVLHYAERRFASWRRNAYDYGRYDVVMERRKSLPTFEIACGEFHKRRRPNRWLTQSCVGRRPLEGLTVLGLSAVAQVADGLGARRVASLALSSLFSVRYWRGASDELGGVQRLWPAVAARTAPEPALSASPTSSGLGLQPTCNQPGTSLHRRATTLVAVNGALEASAPGAGVRYTDENRA